MRCCHNYLFITHLGPEIILFRCFHIFFSGFISEHQELSHQIQEAIDPRLKDDLERELDSLVAQMEAKGDQIAQLRRHREKVNCVYVPCCCYLPTSLTLVCVWGGSPIIPLLVHQPAYLSIWPAALSLQRGLSTNPGVIVWCVCGCS